MIQVTELELVYQGEELKDGSIPIGYLIYALSGFSGAYEKLSGQLESPDDRHHIRVLGLRQGSSHILLDIVHVLNANQGVVAVGIAAIAPAQKIISEIATYIKNKKHLKGKEPKNAVVFEDGKLFLVSPEGERIEITKEEANRLVQGLLDSDAEKMVMPLHDDRVSGFEIKQKNQSLVKVSSEERQYFTTKSIEPVAKQQNDQWVEGTLNSFSKDKAKGTFHTVTGKHIPYRYIGNDTHQLFQAFAYDGVVRALADVRFDRDNNPRSMDIKAIVVRQQTFFN
jgi:hypothetical protein